MLPVRCSGTGLIDEALDASFPLDDLVDLVDLGQVWVACGDEDLPVGMVITSLFGRDGYMEEMDVCRRTVDASRNSVC